MATIKDIAEAAGVSRGTVSNVLNGRDVVSSEKIQKVMKVVEEMGYSINEKAQNLRKGSAKLLGVAFQISKTACMRIFIHIFTIQQQKRKGM